MERKNIFGFVALILIFLMLFSPSEYNAWKWFLAFAIIFSLIWIIKSKLIKTNYNSLLIISLLFFFSILFTLKNSQVWKIFLFLGVIFGVWWLIKKYW